MSWREQATLSKVASHTPKSLLILCILYAIGYRKCSNAMSMIDNSLADAAVSRGVCASLHDPAIEPQLGKWQIAQESRTSSHPQTRAPRGAVDAQLGRDLVRRGISLSTSFSPTWKIRCGLFPLLDLCSRIRAIGCGLVRKSMLTWTVMGVLVRLAISSQSHRAVTARTQKVAADFSATLPAKVLWKEHAMPGWRQRNSV